MKHQHGLSLVEMLIAAALLVIVLGLVTVYFGAHERYARQTEAHTEVQDKVRMVMQMVTQDLQMAGAQRYVYSNGTMAANVTLPSCDFTSTAGINCLAGQNSTTPDSLHDSLGVLYITGLKSLTNTTTIDGNQVCRSVEYKFSSADPNTLERSDVDCFDSTGVAVSPSFSILAKNILVLNIQYVCSNGAVLNTYPDPQGTTCMPGTSYPRTARVTVYGRSNFKGSGASEPAFQYVTYNSDGTPASPEATVACPSGYVCYGMAHDVLLPNLKDR